MRSGTVAVVGRANAGKSTLVNAMVGEKVAIVSPKPQTTRDRIMGILNRSDRQIVFVDTPGIYRRHNALNDLMMRTTETTSRDVDLLLFVHDGHAGVKEEDIALMKKFGALGVPMLVAYNKTDIMPAEHIPADAKRLFEGGIEAPVYAVSARRHKNLNKLEEAIFALLPEGEPLFPEGVLSDRSEKFMIGELMREKILLGYGEEIPHGVAVVVNLFEKRENGTYCIDLDVVCEKKNHKAILIGKQGKSLKETATHARLAMEQFLGAKVYLTVYVKVREDWRDRPSLIRDFGYSSEE